MSKQYKQQPAAETIELEYLKPGGFIGKRLKANRDNWSLTALDANPAMTEIFRMRDRRPRLRLMPWSGEFAGKYLTSLTAEWRMSKDLLLERQIHRVISELADVQDADGYLGPFPESERLIGKTIGSKDNPAFEGLMHWDLWGHYHCMLGLLSYFLESRTYRNISHTGGHEGAEERERFGLKALAEKAFFELPKPRWESLHDIQAVAELYFLSGEQQYKTAFQRLWRSIADGDRHNSGGFTTGEKATGNPYADGAIETCCTVSWTALSVDMLRMSANSLTADELELSFFNGILGAQHPSGRWWTYNTPMDGVRRASAHDIVFQAYQGMPELNCCSVNGPRGLGMLGCWACMRDEAGVFINYYGQLEAALMLPSGNRLQIRQKTGYPLEETICIEIYPKQPEIFDLRLRIPSWSLKTRLHVTAERNERGNGENTAAQPEPGRYVSLKREWKRGDTIVLELDLSPHYWIGEREKTGFFSIYRGPVLLAYDQYCNSFDPEEMPVFSLPLEHAEDRDEGYAEKTGQPPEEQNASAYPIFQGSYRDRGGRQIVLCDFASAGAAGTEYRSWLPYGGTLPSTEVSPGMPIWTRRV